MKGWTLLNLFRHIEFLWILIVSLKTNKNIKLLYQQLTLIFCVTTQYLRDLSSWTHRQQTSDIMDIWIGIVQVLPIIVNKLKSLKVAKWRKDEWRMMKVEWRMKEEWWMMKNEWWRGMISSCCGVLITDGQTDRRTTFVIVEPVLRLKICYVTVWQMLNQNNLNLIMMVPALVRLD